MIEITHPVYKSNATSLNYAVFFGQLLQLGVLGLITYLLGIEADLGLVIFFPILIASFTIHALLPKIYKPVFFFSTFVLTLILFLSLRDASLLLLVGGAIFSVCHLPIALSIRKLIVLFIGIGMAILRFGVIESPMSSHAMTVFAAIFMFRTILYLYELKYEKEEVSIWHRLNYFFLLPNIVLPLFPIVDYKTYLKTYYNTVSTEIYARGIRLIAWSLCCLLIYRYIYYFLVPDIYGLEGLYDVSQYIVASYLTVIRLIGLLSLSIGILRLFGYNLPDIFNYMFFASSFADLFRRINIYWKSFLIKICYYPVYFKIRKRIPNYSLTVATLVTFFFTWFFHIYQWAWILGSNPIRDTSLIYWGAFGFVATANTLMENKKTKPTFSLQHCLIHATKVVGTFLAMAMLYSMWISPSFYHWLGLLSIAVVDDQQKWILIGGGLLATILIGGVLYYLFGQKDIIKKTENFTQKTWNFNGLLLLLLVFAGGLHQYKSSNLSINKFVEGKAHNINDQEREYVGYYNEILKADIASKLWDDDLHVKNNKKEKFKHLSVVDHVNDVTNYRMKPNKEIIFRGKILSSNSSGFRDKDYPVKKDEHTIRIAVMGASPTYGVGVGDDEVFEGLVEQKLNEIYGTDSRNFELINFALPSMCVFHYIYLMEEEVKKYEPDYVLLVDHSREFHGYIKKLKRVIDNGNDIYPAFETFLTSNNILPLNNTPLNSQNAEGEKIANWGFDYFKNQCDTYNFQPIWIFVPPVNKDDIYEQHLAIVEKFQYDTIVMDDLFDGKNEYDLQVQDNDKHPNAKGHQLIADRLFQELVVYLKLDSKSTQ